jgi:hypothetical protein
MEAPNPGDGSWLARGLCLAPVIVTVAFAHRRMLSRLWHGSGAQIETDEKGRAVVTQTAPRPHTTAATAGEDVLLSPPRPLSPPRQRCAEDKECDDDGDDCAQAELYLLQRTIMRMARTGDVEGLLALLEALEETERREAEAGQLPSQLSSSSTTRSHGQLFDFVFGVQRPRSAPRRPTRETRRRIPRQTSMHRVAEDEEEEEDVEDEDQGDGAAEGCSPMFVAALNGRAPMVQLLLARGARLDLRSTHDGVHPLYAACLEGHIEVVRALLDGAVDVNAVGVEADGSTALMGCCEGGHVELARLLLEHGADADARGRSGATALFYATQQGHVHVVRLLVAHRQCDVNARKNDGSTALFLGMNL